MKIAILGSSGMLGGMVVRELSAKHEVVKIGRDRLAITEDLKALKDSLDGIRGFDYIINCIGAIKPRFSDPAMLGKNVVTNSIFPWLLAEHGKRSNTKVIHITTDCVYRGTRGKYTEKSAWDADDNYGISKVLGEPTNCMVLRTSIIGPEWDGNKRSLVEWLVSNKNGTVNGFTNHMWNGLTTLELAKCLDRIVTRDYYSDDCFHLFADDNTKYDMLKIMSDAWNLNITVKPVEDKISCDRTLRTVKNLNYVLFPKSFKNMIGELSPFINV
jgi:dTDP-4-dehydrorhamnose reductase